MIKILSWNIQQGGGSRVNQIVNAISAINAHIVVLSEYRNNDKGIKIRYKLLQLGYRYQAVTAAKPNVNSVAIFSSLPSDTEIMNCSDKEYSCNVIKSKFKAFSLYGGYFPHKKKHQLFDWLIDELTQQTEPFVICGDLNTGKNYLDQKGNSFWYEEQFIKLSQDIGKDAFRLIHGDQLEYSWFSHQKNGYRYDHTIVSPDIGLLTKSCYYLQNYRIDKFSDHAPMILELG